MFKKQCDSLPDHPSGITASWLTSRFREFGLLDTAEIKSLEIFPVEKWNVAQTARFAIAYSGQVNPAIPERIFVKITDNYDPLKDIFPGEHVFYAEELPDDLPLARCYGVLQGSRPTHHCVILQDYTETHSIIPWPNPPSIDRCLAAVTSLGILHGYWWQETVSNFAHAEKLISNERRLGEYFQPLLPQFFDFLRDRLGSAQCNLIETVCDRIPQLKGQRLTNGKPITRIHGDPHFWNFMYPKYPGREPCIVIDWEDWRDDIGGSDLAALTIMHWDPEYQARYQKTIFDSYLEALSDQPGVIYRRDDLLYDFRLGHMQNIVAPIFQQQMGRSREDLWPYVYRWLKAFDDLDCRGLL